MKAQGKLDLSEWMFLLTGGVGLENKNPNPSSWLPKKYWDELCRLNELPAFQGLVNSFSKDLANWEKVYDSQVPSSEKLPAPWDSKLNKFQKLCVLRCIRPDKLVPAVQDFVTSMKQILKEAVVFMLCVCCAFS